MGYTHYWYRPKEIPKHIFKRMVDDFKKLIPPLKMIDVKLAGPEGTGDPVINYDAVIFNGSANCGHPRGEIVVPWPDDEIVPFVATEPGRAISGEWFGGHLLRQRVCNGDCSYEAFVFPRIEDRAVIVEVAYYESRLVGKVFDFCKTGFRPYDIAVTSFLTIAKYHLGEEIIVKTDGEHQHWEDAFHLCQYALGYGLNFAIRDHELVSLSGYLR